MRKTKARRKRKHTIGYYLTCGAPLTPIAHLEQLFAEGEPVWTTEFGAARSARKPGADEQAEITARSDACASAPAPRSSRRTRVQAARRIPGEVAAHVPGSDASARRASPSARRRRDDGPRAAERRGRAAEIGLRERIMPPNRRTQKYRTAHPRHARAGCASASR